MRNTKYKPSLTLYLDASAIWLEPAKREKGSCERISREKRGQLVAFIASTAFLSFHARIAQQTWCSWKPSRREKTCSSIEISGNVRNQSDRKSPDRQDDILLLISMYQFALHSHCSAEREAKFKDEPIVQLYDKTHG